MVHRLISLLLLESGATRGCLIERNRWKGWRRPAFQWSWGILRVDVYDVWLYLWYLGLFWKFFFGNCIASRQLFDCVVSGVKPKYGMNSGWAPLPPPNFWRPIFSGKPAVLVTLRFRIMTGYCKVGFHDSEWPPDVTNDGFRRTAAIFCCMGTPAPPNGPTCFFEFLGWVICSSWPNPMQVTWNLLRSTNTISPFRGVDIQFSNLFYLRNGFDFFIAHPGGNFEHPHLSFLANSWVVQPFNHHLVTKGTFCASMCFLSHFLWQK